MTFIVRGRYCPTDANPEQDAREETSEEECETHEEAEMVLLWYPGGTVEP